MSLGLGYRNSHKEGETSRFKGESKRGYAVKILSTCSERVRYCLHFVLTHDASFDILNLSMILRNAIEKRQREEISALRFALIDRARKVAIMLKEKYGAKKVLLFGSIVRKDYLHKRTDIDLLVEGIRSEDILRAGADAWEVASPFDVDIIPIELADEAIISTALKEGMEL